MAEPTDEPASHPPRHPALHILRQVAGWFCIVLAVVGLLIPVFPHTPFLALGAILLAPYIRIFRRISAWVHKKFPRTRPHLRRFRIFKRPWRAALRTKVDTPSDPAA
jgi:uncharacterized membrane protein YbaN (DUF454 family)